ncbi:MAG: aminopeptidase P family protein [Clostridium perfringens]|nr:aminopeptidase P family protein [Clostridium perfringens]
MKKQVFIKNRDNLANLLENNSLVILFAGEAIFKSADEKYPFTPNRNFYYLTGINEEQHILVMEKQNDELFETMYILRPDEMQEKWTGKTIRDYEAREVSGIEEVKYLDNFHTDLNNLLISGNVKNVYLDLERRGFDEELRFPQSFAKNLKKKYADVTVKNVYNEIANLRKVKSKEEIEEMQKAIDITTKGVEVLMKNCKSGMKEYELEAYFDFTLKQSGVTDFAFNTIAASGKNATVLHYVDNNSELKDGDLILFDLGAQFNYYNGDISRTFPISGKFSNRQKEVYEEVLKVNEEITKMLVVGITFREVNDRANDLIAKACKKLGLIEDEKDFRKYYFHSIGHSLGLDTHDVGERYGELKEGMVFTVEPGLYIPEEEIGIRIEDDVLITKEGPVVLTKDCIKTVEEIENFMANR